MEQLSNLNWLDFVVIAIILYNGLTAYSKGLILTVFKFTYMILAIIITKMFYGPVSAFLRNSTPLYDMLKNKIGEALSLQSLNVNTSVNEQVQNISSLKLPSFLQEGLLENNNYEVYDILGVKDFGDYIAAYLSNMTLNIIAMILVFIAATIILKVLINIFDLISKLPILNSLNKLSGLAVGLALGVVTVWIGCIIITLFYTNTSFHGLVETLESSKVAIWFYENNLLASTILSIIL